MNIATLLLLKLAALEAMCVNTIDHYISIYPNTLLYYIVALVVDVGLLLSCTFFKHVLDQEAVIALLARWAHESVETYCVQHGTAKKHVAACL
jgi:hypothetical protein